MKSISRNNQISLYVQLKVAIRDMVLTQLEPGDKIPTEYELSNHYNVSRITVRQAIATLVSEGLLYRERGRGTFVAPRKVQEDLNVLKSFEEEMEEKGFKTSAKVLDYEEIPVNEMLKNKLHVHDGDKIFKIKRLIYVNKSPVTYQVSYIPQKICPDLFHKDLTQTLFKIIEKEYNYEIKGCIDTIECIKADQRRAVLLRGTKGDPILFVERLIYADTKVPVIFSRTFYKSDQVKLRINRERV